MYVREQVKSSIGNKIIEIKYLFFEFQGFAVYETGLSLWFNGLPSVLIGGEGGDGSRFTEVLRYVKQTEDGLVNGRMIRCFTWTE